MPQIVLRGPGGCRTMHWPWDATVWAMQARLCSTFRRDFRTTRAAVSVQGRELRDFERPWFFAPRWLAVEVGVAFLRHTWQLGAYFWDADPADEDVSDGYTTSSSIAEAVETMSLEFEHMVVRR
jgi:hypothetical protein